MKHIIIWVCALTLGFTMLACEPKNNASNAPQSADTITHQQAELATQVVWQFAYEALKDIHEKSKTLFKDVKLFLDQPSEDSLKNAQQSWLTTAIATRKYYAAKDLSTFSPHIFKTTDKLNNKTLALPIMPGFIDSFGPYQHSGLVNDISLPLTLEGLVEQHGATDKSEIILGLYAIEYILFGENSTRSPEHFVYTETLTQSAKNSGLKSPSELANNRRRVLLQQQVTLLRDDFNALKLAWSPHTSDELKSWFKLIPTTQQRSAIQSLNKSITQLLIEIVEINKPDLSVYDGHISPTIYVSDNSTKANWLSNTYAGLSSFKQYLTEEQTNTFDNAMTALQSLTEQLSQSSEENSKIWEDIYSNTKALRIKPPAPEQ